MAKKTKRPAVRNMTYQKALAMSHEYNEMQENYLRSIVRNHIPDAENILACADRKYLLHMTRTIKGVADRLVEDYRKKQKTIAQEIGNAEPVIQANIDLLGKCKDLDEGALLEERICIQLEACRIPDNSKLVRNYELARDNYNNQFKGKQGYLF